MKPPKFKYRGFGLNISSDIEFPELLSYDFEAEDVRIEAKPIEDSWFDANEVERVLQHIEPGLYKCLIPDVGRYVVTNGILLQIEPLENADMTGFRMYVLTTAFSACLVQRGLTLLHAAGVILDGAVFLLAGASGVGKSTLLSLLMKRGHRLFSDDVCVFNGLKNDQGRWLVSSSYPVIKVDGQGLVRFFPNADRKKLWPDAEKFGVFFHDQYEPDPLPVCGIAIVSKDQTIRQIKVEQVNGILAFEKLSACTYRPGLIRTKEQQIIHARVVSGLVQDIPIYDVRRPEDQNDGYDLVSAVETLTNFR